MTLPPRVGERVADVAATPEGPPSPAQTIARAALALARAGLHVIPQDRQKRPFFTGWLDAASRDPHTITAWWRRWPGANVAAVLGPSNLAVVDVDRHPGQPDGFVGFAALESRLGPLPASVRAETGGGGLHVYFRAPAGVRGHVDLAPGVEFLAGRRAVVLPPSVHATGRAYVWTSRAPLAELPPAWAALATQVAAPLPTEPPRAIEVSDVYLARALSGEVGRVLNAVPGTRGNTLCSAAFKIGRIVGAGIGTFEVAAPALVAAGVATGLPEGDVRATVDRALRSGAGNPRRIVRRGDVR